MKKALIENCIYDFADEHNINTAEELMHHLPILYGYLRRHPNFGDLLDGCPYDAFKHYAELGLMQAMTGIRFRRR